MTRFAGALAFVIVMYGLHRLATWMEDRRWIYYRKRRGSSGTLTSAALEIQALLEPQKRHVLEVTQRDEPEEQNSSGRRDS